MIGSKTGYLLNRIAYECTSQNKKRKDLTYNHINYKRIAVLRLPVWLASNLRSRGTKKKIQKKRTDEQLCDTGNISSRHCIFHVTSTQILRCHTCLRRNRFRRTHRERGAMTTKCEVSEIEKS